MVRMVPQTLMTNNEADELTFEPDRLSHGQFKHLSCSLEQLEVGNQNIHLRLCYRLKFAIKSA
jgi:hypothetical protein